MSREWILLRGLAREQAHWGAFIPALTQIDSSAHIQAIDLPGAGKYHRLSSPTTITGIAEFVHSHFHANKPQQRVLVAISLGGMVAAEIARLYPQEIDGLVLMNTSFRNLSPFYQRLRPEALMQMYKAGSAKTANERELAIMNMVSNRPDRETFLQEWVDIAQARPVTPINFAKQMWAAATYSVDMKKPSVPVLVLTSQADHMVNPLCSRKLAEEWEAPLEIHPHAGHELAFDAPEWVAEQIRNYFVK